MQRYTVFYFCKLLYMFRVDPPPISRSITLYLQHLLFVKPLPLTNTTCFRYSVMLLIDKYQMRWIQCYAPDDGWGSTRNM